MGSGRTEVFDRLFGLTTHGKGTIRLDAKPFAPKSPGEAIAADLAYVTEDRKKTGLILSASVRNNICMANLPSLSGWFGMRAGLEKAAAMRMVDIFDIKAASTDMEVSSLSGGNQQKVVLAKCFLTAPRILLLDEPTRGVDVGAKSEIYRIVSEFVAQGGAVLMISSETEEVLGLADRVVVMRDGAVAGLLDRSEMSSEKLLHLAA
jgi:putative xylitol transport system ATP-binding protein